MNRVAARYSQAGTSGSSRRPTKVRMVPERPKPSSAVLMTRLPKWDQLVIANMRMAASSYMMSAVDRRNREKKR